MLSRTRAAIQRPFSLPSFPYVTRGLVADNATIIANSASGVTGAGNSPKRELLFGEVSDDYRAYGVGNTHRHLKEMGATLAAAGSSADLVFTPHLLPVARGILSSITIPAVAPRHSLIRSHRSATHTNTSRSWKWWPNSQRLPPWSAAMWCA